MDEFELVLPAELSRFGRSTRATVTGPADGPVVIVLGGISASRFVCGAGGWWPGMVGDEGAVDPRRHRVLGIDFIADKCGGAAPSCEDQAAVICKVLDRSGVDQAHAVVGASYGGMVALSLGQHFPARVKRIVVISAGASAHPAATALRELQRRVVALGIAEGAAAEALSIARGMAMLSYRTSEEFERRFAGGLGGEEPLGRTEPGDYLRARGEAFQAVMSPGRFLSLSASIDRHRIDPAAITTPALLIGAESDQLVPPSQMEALAAALAGPAALRILPSLYGHDMFLKDAARMADIVRPFLEGGQ
ncbi:homoserine O-succinyltransferase MetX [Allosphingosinicella sp.]|uniref:homoserine O-succinyltransferase MetX n=1 Tax=Allosphingosinicella sp. TaxID=2823234 RepID=UPI002FC183F5